MGTARDVGHSRPRARSAEPRRGRRRAEFGPAPDRARGRTARSIPLVASDFFVAQIGAYSLIWGMIALSLMLLAGYGGMVSLAQITVAGVAAYAIAIFGTNNSNIHGFGWPWWVAGAVRGAARRARLSALIGCDLGAHRGHLHDHDHAGDRRRLLLLRAAELRDLQRTFRLCRHSHAARLRHRLARSGALLLSLPAGRGGLSTPPCSTARARPSAWPCRRSATTAGACARSASTSPRTRSSPISTAGVIAGLAGVLLVWFNGRVSPGTIDVEQAIEVLVIAVIGGLRHPIGPFLGAVVRHPDPDLRHRYRRRRTLQYADRPGLSGDRLRLAGWPPWACGGGSSRSLPQESLRSRRVGGSVTSSTKQNQREGGSE